MTIDIKDKQLNGSIYGGVNYGYIILYRVWNLFL